jgi:hypothetical protein
MSVVALLGAAFVVEASTYPGLWVDVLSETTPPGGTAQIKYTLTSPGPIILPIPRVTIDAGLIDAIEGVSLYNSSGDVFGAAVIQGASVQVSAMSPSGTFGTDIQDPRPWMTIAMHVRPDASAGQTSILNYSSDNPSVYVDAGTLSIGGSLSISNIIPGGGHLAVGTVVRVLGTGFWRGVRLSTPGLRLSEAWLANSSEIDFVLAQSATMDGQAVTLTNPDGSAVTYYSYLRGTPVIRSSVPLFAATIPIFPTKSRTCVRYVYPPAGTTQVYGLAIQNPGSAPVRVWINLNSPTGSFVANTAIDLPAYGQVTEALSELFDGISPRAGIEVDIQGSSEIQVVGLLGDTAAWTVVPISRF